MNLRSIDVRNNKLCSIPEQLFDLINLWKLQLDNNLLEKLPDCFDKLKTLKILTVSNNKLNVIPQSIFTATSLIEKLDVSNNNIQELA